MNKKLIAIAVASIMATPVMAADLKISGRLNQQFLSTSTDIPAPGVDTDTLGYSDNGHQRIQFDVKAGDAFGRFAFDARSGKGLDDRDNYIGYKFGSSSIQFGRMANAGKNIEKDPLIATFLEERSSVVAALGAKSSYDSNGFIDQMAQFATKVGGVAIKVQAGLADGDATGAANQGHFGISATGKAGGVRWFVSHNNVAAETGETAATSPKNDDSILKVGASMKFGKVKASLTLKNAEDNNDEAQAIVLRANMGFGNGLTGYVGYGINTFSTPGNPDVDATWLRLAVAKQLNKSTTFYGGYTSNEWDAIAGQNDVSTLGVGMTIKF